MPTADEVRDQVSFTVLNELKGKKAISEISGSDLQSIASQYGTAVDSFSNLNMLNPFVQGLGNEPKVLGAAAQMAEGSVSGPIMGNSGVFLIKTLKKQDAGAISGISFIKRTIAGNKKSGFSFGFLDALKKQYDIKDNRSVFY